MKKIYIKKDGKNIINKEGKEIYENMFEEGDIFIPSFSNILIIKKEITNSRGKKQNLTIYKLRCKIKDKDGNQITDLDKEGNETNEIYVKLTPTQGEFLINKKSQGLELNQNLFYAYSYESKNYGEQVGICLYKDKDNAEKFKPGKNFDDFEELKNTEYDK